MHFTSPKSKVTIHPRSNFKPQLGDKLRNHQKPHLGSLLQVGLAEAAHVRVFGWILRSKVEGCPRGVRSLENVDFWKNNQTCGCYKQYIGFTWFTSKIWTCGFWTWTARNLESWNLPSLDGEMLISQATLVKLVKFESWAAVQHGDGAAWATFLFLGHFIGQRQTASPRYPENKQNTCDILVISLLLISLV